MEYLAHHLEAAEQHWRRALELEPRLRDLKERLLQLEQERALETGQSAGETGIFVVRAPAGSAVDPAGIGRELQRAQQFLEQSLQFRLKGPVAVLIYPSSVFHGDLHVPTSVAGLYDGKVRLAVPENSPAAPSLKAVLWHELAHAAVTQLSHGQAPRWLHEGIAQVVHSEVEPVETADLKILLRQQEAPAFLKEFGRQSGLIRIDAAPALRPQLFYQASWGYVRYAVEHRGWAGVKKLLLNARQGSSPSEALAALSGMKETEWEKQWNRWIQHTLYSL